MKGAAFIGATMTGLVVIFTPLGTVLERSMVTHILIEYPMLIAVGLIIGVQTRTLSKRLNDNINGGGIPGILLASFVLAFWMIPRWLDASVTDDTIDVFKHCTLIVLVGVPIAWSWPRVHSITEGLVKIEFLTMLFRLGWIYQISPQRLCNNYLLDDQIMLGRGLLILAVILTVVWAMPVVFGANVFSPKRQSTVTER